MISNGRRKSREKENREEGIQSRNYMKCLPRKNAFFQKSCFWGY